MRTQTTLPGILCLVPLISWPHAAAAPITFTAPSNISGELDVSTVGVPLAAYDWSSNAQTVNNVPFTTATANNGAVGANITLSTFGVANTGSFTSTSNPFNSLPANYKSMLAGSVYNSATGTTATVSLNGFTTGHRYLVQAWVSDPRSGGPASRIQTITGSGPGLPFDFNSTNAAGGLGQVVNGYFVADGAASTFTLSSTAPSLPQLNAIQIRDVTGVWSGSVNGNWDETTTNFSGLDFTAAKALRDSVYFGDHDAFGTAVTNSTLTIASGGVTGSNAVFTNNTVAYTLNNAGATGLTGPHSLTVGGSGTVTLNGAHSYTGGTIVRAGTLALGGSDFLPTTGTLTFGGFGTVSLGNNSQTLDSLLFATQANTSAVVTGSGGSLLVNGPANLQVGPGGVLATNFSSSLNLSGLGSFTYNAPANIFRVGLQGGTTNSVALGAVATATLAPQNSIAANLLAVGDVGSSSDGGISVVHLGAANDIRTNTINVGASDRSDATLDFAAAGSAATLRGPAGGVAPVNNFDVGSVSTFSTAGQQAFTADALFANGTLDAIVTSMNVGVATTKGSTNRSGTVVSTVSMGAGSLTVGTLNLGRIEGAGSIGAAFGGSGAFTLNHASGTVTADTITLAANTITATGAFTKTTSGTFNLTDGTLVATTVQRGAQTGTATSTAQLNWQNGLIRNKAGGDLTIGAGIDLRIANTGTHTLSIDDGHTATIGAAISDLSSGGTIIKDGPGAAVFTGASTYSGATTVNAGTLRVTGTMGATNVQLPAGRFSMENQAAGALTVSSVAQTGGDLVLDVGPGGADLLTVTNGYARSAGEIRLILNGAPPAGSIPIVSYQSLGGTPPVSVPDSRFTATPSYGSGAFDQITVTFSGSAGALTWTGANGNAWDLNTTPNWNNGGSPDVFKLVDQVTFPDGPANTSPVLAGTISPGSVTFTNNTSTYTLSGAGIAGSGGLTQAGSGSTVLANNNTFTGATTVNQGTLQIGSGGATGSLAAASSITVNAPATLQFFRSDNNTVIGSQVTGNGALKFMGTGVSAQSGYQMAGNNTGFTGTVLATAARVGLGNINGLGSADVEVENGAGLYLSVAGNFANDVWITGNGWPESAGTLGAIRLQGGVNASGILTLTGPARIAAHGSTGTLSGQLVETGGAQALELANTSGTADSTITLANTLTSTRSGPTTVNNAIVVANTNQGFGSGAITIQGPTRSGRIRLGDTVNVSNPVTLEANAGFTGRGVIEVAGTAAATWSGAITANAIPAAGGTFYTEAGASLTLSGPITGNFNQRDGNVTYAGGGFYTAVSATGLVKVGAANGLSTDAIVTLGGSGAATLDLNGFHQTLTGLTKGANAATVTNNGAADSTLTIDADIDSIFAGTIVDGPTNNVALVKTGTAVFTLGGINTYSGATTVTAGTLLVNGSLDNTVVSTSGTLGGTGIIAGPVTIQTGGTLAPGTAAGTLTTGDVVFKPGSAFDFEIANPLGTTAGTDWDLLDATGITFEATPANKLIVRISDLAEDFVEVSKSYVIASTTGTITGFNAAAVQIDTAGFSGTGTWSIRQSGSTIELVYVGGAMPPYDSWSLNNITALNPAAPAGFDDNADGDTIPNGLEWILGGNPLAADGSTLVGVTATPGGGLVLTFKRAEDSIGQATLAVEWDTDLASGFAHSVTILNAIPASGNNPVVAINTAATPDVVTVTIPAANASPGGKIFARLKAQKP